VPDLDGTPRDSGNLAFEVSNARCAGVVLARA